MNNYRRIGNLRQDERGDARLYAAFGMMGVLTIMTILMLILSESVEVGPEEGKLAPNLTSDSHALGDSSWQDFDLYDELQRDWVVGEPGQYFLIQFIDTDCGHCWKSDLSTDDGGGFMSSLHNEYSDRITFITVATSLGIPGWETNKDEISAFQGKSDYGTDADDGDGCNTGRNNCNQRPGEAHDWLYLDDTNGKAKDDWNVRSTPHFVLLDPSGYVEWNGGQHLGEEDHVEAVLRIFG